MTHSIDTLPRLSRGARQALHEMGIHTLEELVALTPDELRRCRGIKTAAEAHLAQARALLDNAPVWLERPACAPTGWMFDIETDPRTDRVWCVGWCDATGTAGVAVSAPHRAGESFRMSDGTRVILVENSHAVWEAFADAIPPDELPIFHWTGFDSAHMQAQASTRVRAKLQYRLRDLHAVFARSVKLPVTSLSLKVVARYMGFDWAAYDDWQAAWNDYRAWQHSDDDGLLARALSYQRDDVIALAVAHRWLIEHMPR